MQRNKYSTKQNNQRKIIHGLFRKSDATTRVLVAAV